MELTGGKRNSGAAVSGIRTVTFHSLQLLLRPAILSRTSVASNCGQKIKVRGVSEGAEVTVARQEGNASIDTTLGN